MFGRYYIGVLFLSIALHTMVSDNANAIYSSQTGRFLNRDPIGYTAGSNNIYEYVAAGPLRANDPFGLCADCKGRGGTPVGGAVTLVDSIEDSEIDEYFNKWVRQSDRQDKDVPEIDRLANPKSKPKPVVYYVYHKKSYKVQCCKEKDGTITFESAAEIPLKPRSAEYSTGSFTVPTPWVLNSANKDAYIAFALPVPFWFYGGAGDLRKCLEASGMGEIGPKAIKRDRDIEGGEKK